MKKQKRKFNKLYLLPIIIITAVIIFFISMSETNADFSVQYIKDGNYLKIKNTGKVTLTNFDIFIDGQKYKTIETRISEDKIIEDIIYTDSNAHIIKVKSNGIVRTIEI